jgi:energy-coupling factor transport system ATP-binding protein
MISIQGLSYRFPGRDQDALRDVNLEIAPGEFVVLAGPSGCGKSTLALAIGGYLFRQYDGAARGSVRVAGMDVRECPIYDVAEVVGLVQQNPEAQFCTLTVRDEIAFGLENRRQPPAEVRHHLEWALEIVGATHLLDRPLATLSGGEKQKIAIAAMMAAKPQMLILDEPTSNLDPSATAEIFQVIAHIREKAAITVIVIEHKLGYLRPFAPRLVRMEQGQIVHDGPMTENDGATPWGGRPGPGSTGRTAAPLVRVEDVDLSYNGRPVLQGLALEIRPGEFVAVMGDNGSGKSTFLQSLLGLLKPAQGRVEALGQDTRHTPTSKLARGVGFVFQNPDHQLFAESVWREATFAPRNFGTLDAATEERVRELLAHSGLAGREDEHPYRLSFGEKRRLNMVSVLASSPRLILLDEVLIGQDPANAAFLMDLATEQVRSGCAVVMVTHDPDVARAYASRLLFFDSGRIGVDAPTPGGFAQLAAQGRRAYLPACWPAGEGRP